MTTIKKLDIPSHQEVILCQDDEAGLKAIIAIHDTTLGPAAGGTRMLPYETEQQALADVLRLSRAMTYKAAAAGVDFGGGKAVIIGDPEQDKSENLLRAFGKFVESLDGRFLTGEDVGTTSDDMRIVGLETKYVVYPSQEHAAELPTSFLTAFGVLRGIQASAKEKFGSDSLSGIKVALQGVGKVGYHLALMLRQEGAKLTMTDINRSLLSTTARELGAPVVEPHEIYQIEAEIFSPCALGGILNDEVIPRLRCEIIAGSANNQLADERHGEELWKRGILYAPDYVINAGGLLSALYEMGRWDKGTVMRKTAEIYDRLREIFEKSRSANIPTHVAADRLAEERIQRAKKDETRRLG
jgi:leucine dehydrogenase